MMRRPRGAAWLLAPVALVSLLGCSKGGSSGGGSSAPASTAPGTSSTTPPATSSADPTDADLAAAFAKASVTPVKPPAPDAPELVNLGAALFFDKVLSGNKNISCASCHSAGSATGDAIPVSMGEGATGTGTQRTIGTGRLIARNSRTLLNVGTDGLDFMFWDGRVHRDALTGELRTPELLLDGPSPSRPQITAQLTSALAAQAMFPVVTPAEMRGQPGTNEVASAVTNEDAWAAIMVRLVGKTNGTVGGIAAYRALFAAAYPTVTNFDDLNFGHAARALAAFERASFVSLGSPFDRYVGGDTTALTKPQRRGAALFYGKAGCATCHSGALLSDMDFHALGVPQIGPGEFEAGEDRGRALLTGLTSDNYKFRTPPLRNVATSGPYLHDGAYVTLDAVVRHHLDPAKGIATYDPTQLPPLFAATLDLDSTRVAARVAAIDPLLGAPKTLAASEIADLVEFLNALTDPGAQPQALQALVPSAVPSGLAVPD